MTQREFHFERASVEAHLQRVQLAEPERRLLIGLVRFYFACRDHGDGRGIRCEDGRVLVEPSKEDLAAVLQCSVPTIKRLLRETRDTAAYVLIETATHRTHCYTIDFPGLYAAPLRVDPPARVPNKGDHTGGSRFPARGIMTRDQGDHDPGSGGSNRGIMTRGHRGGKGGIHPSPSVLNEMNSMESMEDGISSKCFQGGRDESPVIQGRFVWRSELGLPDLQDPDRMQDLYEQALQAGRCNASEVDRQLFFALIVHYRDLKKKPTNRIGLLTSVVQRGCDGLKRPWRQIPTSQDLDKANAILKAYDYPPLQESAGSDLWDCDGDDSDEWASGEGPEAREEGPKPETLAPRPGLDEATLELIRVAQNRRRQEVTK